MAKEEKRRTDFDLRLTYAPGKPALIFTARIPDWLELEPGLLKDATPEDKSRLADAAMLVLQRVVRNTPCEATFVREGDVEPLQYTFDPKAERKRAHERRREKRRRKEAERQQQQQQQRIDAETKLLKRAAMWNNALAQCAAIAEDKKKRRRRSARETSDDSPSSSD